MSLHLTNYRLCVSASGSLIIVIFSFCTFTMLVCLHFGQKSGKFLSSVSLLTIILVLFLHTGHKSQVVSLDISSVSITPSYIALLYGIHFSLCIPITQIHSRQTGNCHFADNARSITILNSNHAAAKDIA